MSGIQSRRTHHKNATAEAVIACDAPKVYMMEGPSDRKCHLGEGFAESHRSTSVTGRMLFDSGHSSQMSICARD